MSDEKSMRRVPKQARSQQRIDLILAAAADLIADIGYDAVTTNAIAERARISIGSLYQYFSNKDAILHAITERYIEHRRQVAAELLQPDVIAGVSLPELVDRYLDPMVAFYQDNPAILHIYLGSDISPEMAAAYAQADADSVAQIAHMIQLRVPHLPDQRAQVVAQVVKAAMKALMGLLHSNANATEQNLISAEFKHMLVAYLESVMQNANDTREES
ncbi:MAG: TetR/AcrR family transcriptional regulator [Chloroflexi bacterium]|nr:TetR/AcrR family transcriptional regulator [Chloroflexota bacterium]